MNWNGASSKRWEDGVALCQLIISCCILRFWSIRVTRWGLFFFNLMHQNCGCVWSGFLFYGQYCSLVVRQRWRTNCSVSRLRVQSSAKGWSTGICKEREEKVTFLVSMATYLLLTPASSLNTETCVCLMWKERRGLQTKRHKERGRKKTERKAFIFSCFSMHHNYEITKNIWQYNQDLAARLKVQLYTISNTHTNTHQNVENLHFK